MTGAEVQRAITNIISHKRRGELVAEVYNQATGLYHVVTSVEYDSARETIAIEVSQ